MLRWSAQTVACCNGVDGAHSGPTTCSIAQLIVDPDEQARLSDQVLVAADRQGLLPWRVPTRLDRAELGLTEAVDQALIR